MRYGAVIFDLFGTLVDNFSKTDFERFLTELAAILQVPARDFVRMWNVETWPMRSRGDFSSLEETFAYICRVLGVQPTDEQIQRAVQKRFAYTRRNLIPRPDVVETLTRLRTMGYKIGLITDCTLEVPLCWEDTLLAAVVDVPIFSCTVKLKKPDPRIYLQVCERLHVQPQNCLYVGDGNSRELTGASAVGMQAVLIRSPHEEDAHQNKEHQQELDTWTGPKISVVYEILRFV